MNDAFYRFIEDEEDGLFKGPYISLKTPFVSATDEECKKIPLDIAPTFPPYKHQLDAFKQLTMKDGHQPKPTLLTTGTGSGKTECFMYPILDYCYHCNRYERQQGVKVIIMYPMNALATDQAKRLAEVIWNDERLKGKVTAGLFVGEGIDAKDFPRDMGADHIIENRDAILDSIPDILLTNFKMLDYGLMRQRFMPLWKGNIDSETKALKFIVLDELHTYDGAQGTDVANLIRRLKLKLGLNKGELCPIGTSATIGTGEDNKTRLCEYASNIFGETFKEENVIEEHRLSVDEYIQKEDNSVPDGKVLKECDFSRDFTVESYMRRLCKVWLGESDISPVEAGKKLRTMSIVSELLKALESGIKTERELRYILRENNKSNRLWQHSSDKICDIAIENLLALIAYAKRELPNGRTIPMLYLQVQLWQRELSGILRYVQTTPEFVWRGSLNKDEDRVALPMYFCRDCGASGWISRKLEGGELCTDVSVVNKAFMAHDIYTVYLNIDSEKHKPIDEFVTNTVDFQDKYYAYVKDLKVANRGEQGTVRLCICRKTSNVDGGNQRFQYNCPECNGDRTVAIIGGRTSSLSSVAISQVLASDFDAAEAKDRKLLVFTNSVQDAAHHAGYYEARTFRFLFRQSMQKYINTLQEPINLVDLQKGFKEYWHKQLSEEDYYNRFLPSDLAKHIDLRRNYRLGNGFMPNFKTEFDLRVDWEIVSEFGLSSQLGRTLEKTGSSATFFSKEVIESVYENMHDWLMSNNMNIVAEQKENFCHFVYGILQRMRRHGAVDHPYFQKYREEKMSSWDLNWHRDGRHFLNKSLGGSMQFPKLVGTNYVGGNSSMLDIAAIRNKQTWYSNYYIDTFNDPYTVNNVRLFNEFICQLFDTMTEVGLLNKKAQGGGNYAICPEQIWVSSKVKHINCSNCQSRLCVAVEDELAEGTKCLDYKCRGIYSREEIPDLNYYQSVYNREVSPRVQAHEHTGLLDRKEREELEKDFKEHPHSNSINVLTATSTLEMGIDIGDLNVMSNTDVPPKPSNFLQRVGRAGRKCGSALILNYVHSGEPHDMYYYTYPEEMMQGDVSTPGCFLEAKDILRRHFLAYCIDTWISEDKDNVEPSRVSDLNLTSRDIFSSDKFFVNRIITFIKGNKVSLITSFSNQYEEKTQVALKHLFETLDDGTFYNYIIRDFETLSKKIISLGEELNEYKNKKKKMPDNDPAIAQINDLIKSTKKQYAQIMRENVIEYMTNAGLLPNYAFPETGVKLQSSIYATKAKEDNDSNRGEPKTFELVRPASEGIKELAPGNSFYTHKYKLKIDGLSTFDWNDDAMTEMRYCSKCDCIALKGEDGYENSECPKCGDSSWAANTHKVLKFTNARSVMHSNEAAFDDKDEDRTRESYIVKRHYIFHHNGAVTSYAMRNAGFGIEFCNNMELYEVNYGMEMQSGSRTEVDEDGNVTENGFVTCKYCGKSTPMLGSIKKTEDQHYRFCNHSKVSFSDDERVFEKLYLYRHIQTEAIKILLPKTIMDEGAMIEMFKAGIGIGMKQYYNSSPEHIRIDTYREMNRATGVKDQYLVMYDIIPGGTGYLSKLYDTEEFTKLLEFAYKQIHECECQYEGKDGCYHCILSYGNQYKRESFSRELADELFEKLIENTGTWETISGSVGTIAQTGVAEDSELELKFVSVLKTVAQQHNWEFEKVPDVTSYRYELHIVDDEGTDIKYHIIPQFSLTNAYGVRLYSIADFQIICMAATINDEVIEDIESIPMWSVYLDGYTYHAESPNMRFYGDVEKREAIRASKSHRLCTWTLTWEDLQLFNAGKEDSLGYNSVTRLMKLLKNPQFGNVVETTFITIEDNPDIITYGATLYSGKLEIDGTAYGKLTDDSTDEEVAKALQPAIHYDFNIVQGLETADKEAWIGFWRRYNILQFFDKIGQETASEDIEQEMSRDEIKELYPGLEDIVDALLDNDIEFDHEGNCDYTDANGEVIASADMILHKYHIAINPFDNDSEAVFKANGFATMKAEEFNINEITGK